MKCLMIEDGKGFFLDQNNQKSAIDTIQKEDIFRLLEIATDEKKTFEMDELTDNNIQNEAHRIIYNNLFGKFSELINNKQRFLDDCSDLYSDALRKYDE